MCKTGGFSVDNITSVANVTKVVMLHSSCYVTFELLCYFLWPTVLSLQY